LVIQKIFFWIIKDIIMVDFHNQINYNNDVVCNFINFKQAT